MCGLAFYLDECVPVQIATELRSDGHDVVHAIDLGHRDESQGWSDRRQLEFAAQQDRVLVTQNRYHFRREHEQFMRRGGTHPGILLLSGGVRPDVLVATLRDFLGDLKVPLKDQCVTVPSRPRQ